MRLCYRARQFWLALAARPDPAALAAAQTVLTQAQWALFRGMQPSEQAHALHILHRLQAQGETDPDLLTAALLHDAGKQRCPLRPWERAVIVLAQAAAPGLVRRWSSRAETDPAECASWRKPFVVATWHAEWGAKMAQQAGASPLVVDLIRRHPVPVPPESRRSEDNLLRKLQAEDDES